MHLLNVNNLKIKQFLEPNIPPYAILSHRWSESELTYRYFVRDELTDHMQASDGYEKILEACLLVREGFRCDPGCWRVLRTNIQSDKGSDFTLMLEWIWIDTCCIDKDSSAELSESIISMYKYYEDAVVCLVFLPSDPTLLPKETVADDERLHLRRAMARKWREDPNEQIKNNDWFLRGWTLQELLASRHILFYDPVFRLLGNAHKKMAKSICSQSVPDDKNICNGGKCCNELHSRISRITKIDEDILRGQPMDRKRHPIARRLAWASKRRVSRDEDMAYSLFGVLGFSVPIMYGEGGRKAFLRLQREILTTLDDKSIFLGRSTRTDGRRPLLASEVSSFDQCHDIELHHLPTTQILTSYSQPTPRGIEITVHLQHGMRPRRGNDRPRFLLPLGAFSSEQAKNEETTYLLVQVFDDHRDRATYPDGALLAEVLGDQKINRKEQRKQQRKICYNSGEIKTLGGTAAEILNWEPSRGSRAKALSFEAFYWVGPRMEFRLYFSNDTE